MSNHSILTISKQILLVSILILSSCSDNDVTPSTLEPAKEIIPLKVGNVWTNKITFYDTVGNITQTLMDSVKVLKDTVFNNERWYSTFIGYDMVYNNGPEGYYTRYQEVGSSVYNIVLQWKYPAIPNQAYTFNGVIIHVASTSDQIEVGSEKLNCYQYKWDYYGIDSIYVGRAQVWICPGIGKVKVIEYAPKRSGGEFLIYKDELVSYKLY